MIKLLFSQWLYCAEMDIDALDPQSHQVDDPNLFLPLGSSASIHKPVNLSTSHIDWKICHATVGVSIIASQEWMPPFLGNAFFVKFSCIKTVFGACLGYDQA